MSGNQVQGPPTVSESIRRQLAVTFSLTRTHHRAYSPPAVSFSCLDTDVETSLKEGNVRNARNLFKTEGPEIFFEIDRERRSPRSGQSGACKAVASMDLTVTIARTFVRTDRKSKNLHLKSRIFQLSVLLRFSISVKEIEKYFTRRRCLNHQVCYSRRIFFHLFNNALAYLH